MPQGRREMVQVQVQVQIQARLPVDASSLVQVICVSKKSRNKSRLSMSHRVGARAVSVSTATPSGPPFHPLFPFGTCSTIHGCLSGCSDSDSACACARADLAAGTTHLSPVGSPSCWMWVGKKPGIGALVLVKRFHTTWAFFSSFFFGHRSSLQQTVITPLQWYHVNNGSYSIGVHCVWASGTSR